MLDQSTTLSNVIFLQDCDADYCQSRHEINHNTVLGEVLPVDYTNSVAAMLVFFKASISHRSSSKLEFISVTYIIRFLGLTMKFTIKTIDTFGKEFLAVLA